MERGLFVVGVILIAGMILLALPIKPSVQTDELKKFASYEELKNFVKTNMDSSLYGFGALEARTTIALGVPSAAEKADYSTTNIQVAGVDEADIVKNDGKYIYTVSGSKVIIVDASPENAKILSEIGINNTQPQEIFINGDRLVVFGVEYNYRDYPKPLPSREVVISPPNYNTVSTFIKVYDVSDRSNPVLVSNLTTNGYYQDSRMIGDYVYAVVNQPVYSGDEIPLPIVRPATEAFPDIYYFDIPDRSYNFVNIVAVNTQNDNDVVNKAFMLPSSQTIFVSADNIYLTYTKWLDYRDFLDNFVDSVVIPTIPELRGRIDEIRSYNISKSAKYTEVQELVQNYMLMLDPEQQAEITKKMQEKMIEFQKEIAKEQQRTIVSKISVSGNDIKYESQGSVPGTVLNQFSMDEHNGYFRIATTAGEIWGGTSTNNMYVLDSGMKIIGKIEDLAPTERIYSVRFMGDRAYMVTFKKVDPLFVIDLSDPTNPRVLGKLKIPGYSDYLHPYDENHIIGIGKETVDASVEEVGGAAVFAWYQGIKLSLFDVTDVENPREISKFNIGDRGTDSEALREHKAFLFDKGKGLLVIPISLHEIEEADPGPTTYGELTFEGVYVLSLNLEDGFRLKGRITHLNESETFELQARGYSYGTNIRRSLYTGNVLYTLSDKLIKMNNLDSLDEINSIKLPGREYGFALYQNV